jgi:hypothetical protein
VGVVGDGYGDMAAGTVPEYGTARTNTYTMSKSASPTAAWSTLRVLPYDASHRTSAVVGADLLPDRGQLRRTVPVPLHLKDRVEVLIQFRCIEVGQQPPAKPDSAALGDDDRAWLLSRLGRRRTAAGDLVVTSDRTRNQARNRDDAAAKLAALVRAARARPKRRKPTRASRGAIERRLAAKRSRGDTKRRRRAPDGD